jgi:hypothetical protein
MCLLPFKEDFTQRHKGTKGAEKKEEKISHGGAEAQRAQRRRGGEDFARRRGVTEAQGKREELPRRTQSFTE